MAETSSLEWNPDEPLCAELIPYVCTASTMPMLRHPLVYLVPYFPGISGHANQVLRHKQAALAEALANNAAHTYLFLHERPYRAEALLAIEPRLSDEEYWSLLRDVYQDSENVEELSELWRELLCADRPNRAAMHHPEEAAALEALPDTIRVWRGAQDDTDLNAGYSWSTSSSVAEWFARRFQRKGEPRLLASGTVIKRDVIAHLLSRGEHEIIVLPENVADVSIKTLTGGPVRTRPK